jgi:hypothetical protein
MKKISNFGVAFVAATILSLSAEAQSIVDPGISVHNYKHPNKAAQAKAMSGNQKIVRVPTLNTVEQYGKYNRSKVSSNTPKYAPRPAALVVTRTYQPQGLQLDPLRSPANYKTPGIQPRKDTTQYADYYETNESVYPTRD